jgi:hypothetical protein
MFAYTGLLLITSVNSRFLQVTNEYEGMWGMKTANKEFPPFIATPTSSLAHCHLIQP